MISALHHHLRVKSVVKSLWPKNDAIERYNRFAWKNCLAFETDFPLNNDYD